MDFMEKRKTIGSKIYNHFEKKQILHLRHSTLKSKQLECHKLFLKQ